MIAHQRLPDALLALVVVSHVVLDAQQRLQLFFLVAASCRHCDFVVLHIAIFVVLAPQLDLARRLAAFADVEDERAQLFEVAAVEEGREDDGVVLLSMVALFRQQDVVACA